MRSLWRRSSRVLRRSGPALMAPVLSVLAVVVLGVQREAGAVLGAAVTVTLWVLQRGSTRDGLNGARAVLATGLALAYLAGAPNPFAMVACAGVLVAVLADPMFRRLCPVRIEQVGLPGYRPPPASRRVGPFHSVTSIWNLLAAVALLVAALPVWVLPLGTVALLGVGAWLPSASWSRTASGPRRLRWPRPWFGSPRASCCTTRARWRASTRWRCGCPSCTASGTRTPWWCAIAWCCPS